VASGGTATLRTLPGMCGIARVDRWSNIFPPREGFRTFGFAAFRRAPAARRWILIDKR